MTDEPDPLPLITRILQRQGADPDLIPHMAARLADELGPYATLDTIAWTVHRLLAQHPEYTATPPPTPATPPPATLEHIHPGMSPEDRRAVRDAITPALQDLGHLPPPPDLSGPEVEVADISKHMTDQQRAAARRAIARALKT